LVVLVRLLWHWAPLRMPDPDPLEELLPLEALLLAPELGGLFSV